ncbi:phosphoglycerate kinase [Patescibacteria group bacterium]|nr:phosphoglycerate kinase [Patescibacteria group bacterium]
MKIKSIRQIKSLKGKRVFLRLDLNVHIRRNEVVEMHKLRMALPIIDYLLKKEARIIIASHLGRPKGKKDDKYSMEPVVRALENLLKTKIKFSKQIIGKAVIKKSKTLKNKEIMILENLRFESGEKDNSVDFAKSLSDLADIYINDAFAVSHRAQSSVDKIKKYLPSYAGFLLEKEINNLSLAFKPKKPFLAVIGGAKISTKVKLLENLSKSANKILIGGALANTLLLAKGNEVGKSLVDKDSLSWSKKFIKQKEVKEKILLPSDFLVENSKKEVVMKKIKDVNKTDKIYDIGPDTILEFSREIKKAQTLIWNGPLGMFEKKKFKQGTMSIARSLALQSKKEAVCIVGGGETVEALSALDYKEYINWISTGGGAMLSFLAKEDMPGLKGLIK